MGIIASCCAAAACSCCVGISCSCCGILIKISRSVATRIVYSTIFIVLSFIAYILSVFAYDIYEFLPDWLSIFGDECTNQKNCSVFTIYRITFALFLYHLLLSVILIGVTNSKDIRAQINNGWWAVKIVLLVIFIIGDFFIPGGFFTFYAWISVFGAGLFILVQLILLIDLAYSWSESWVAKWNEGGIDGEGENKSYYYSLLGCSFIFLIISLLLSIMMYILFCGNTENCWYNPLMITANLFICIILVVLSIHPRIREFNDRVGLLQASIFTVYCTYYILSAILSEPNSCSDLPFSFLTSDDSSDSEGSSIIDWLTLIVGAVFTVASVVYASISVGSSNIANDFVNTKGIDDDESKAINPHDDDDDHHDDDDEKDKNTYNYSLFHLAFALGAMYVAMLLSNWSVVSSDLSDSGGVNTGETDSGWVALGVKLLSVFVAFGLYTWVIFAPAILRNRSWD